MKAIKKGTNLTTGSITGDGRSYFSGRYERKPGGCIVGFVKNGDERQKNDATGF